MRLGIAEEPKPNIWVDYALTRLGNTKDVLKQVLTSVGLTQLLVEALVFMSWRAAVGGKAIPQTMGETASAVYDRLAAT